MTNVLADAIIAANNDATAASRAASTIAKALASGGNQASVFANALKAAVAKGGCGAVNNILSRKRRQGPAGVPAANRIELFATHVHCLLTGWQARGFDRMHPLSVQPHPHACGAPHSAGHRF